MTGRHRETATLSRTAPAKLNLVLAVTGARPDGYHTLRSVFLRIALADDVAVGLAPPTPPGTPGTSDRLVIEGDPSCPVEDNLVLRAAAVLRGLAADGRRMTEAPRASPLPALLFRLRKRIPMGAGLAGGSSDGAAALDLAADAWGLRLHPTARLEAALRLGADVPFFAAGHDAALVAGIGEALEPLPGLRTPAGVLLVTPGVRLATAQVFREHDGGALGPAAADPAKHAADALADRLRDGLDGPELAGLACGLRDANDLWPAALRLVPALGELRASLERATGRPFLLTGSGSTLFCLYPSPSQARAAAGTVNAALAGVPAGSDAWVEATSTSTRSSEEMS
jgi:4-diphosphocytidyl-2-C-methyl-D-erythritol kinase